MKACVSGEFYRVALILVHMKKTKKMLLFYLIFSALFLSLVNTSTNYWQPCWGF